MSSLEDNGKTSWAHPTSASSFPSSSTVRGEQFSRHTTKAPGSTNEAPGSSPTGNGAEELAETVEDPRLLAALEADPSCAKVARDRAMEAWDHADCNCPVGSVRSSVNGQCEGYSFFHTFIILVLQFLNASITV